jgi:hypothetical protein
MESGNAGQAAVVPGDIAFMKKMSSTARAAMREVGFPVEVRDKIIDLTPYANDKVIHFLKENMGEHEFSRFIYLVTLPTYITSSHSRILLNKYPSWLIDIIEEYLNLLKSVQDLPNIFGPLREISDEYVKTRGYYDPRYTDQEFIDLSSRIVSVFITKSKLDSAGEDTTRIKIFFTNVVNILLKFINDNSSSLDISQYNLAARLRVQGNIQDIIIPFLRTLTELNKNEQNHKIIQRFNLKTILHYGKAERESDIRKLQEQDPKQYRDEWSIARGLDELYEERQEERNRRRQAYAGQGGRRKKNTHSSRKKRNSKKRAYKKRSYKNSYKK